MEPEVQTPPGIVQLVEKLSQLHGAILKSEEQQHDLIRSVHPNYRYSAVNFVRYLKLRTYDIRGIQGMLSVLGVSSLSHAERQVLANIENLLYLLSPLSGKEFTGLHPFGKHPVNFIESGRVLMKNARRLFGDHVTTMGVMVTLPPEGIEEGYILRLLKSGMSIARINCAHDSIEDWRKMAGNVRKCSSEHGIPCSVYVDLAGPKIRTIDIAAPDARLDKKGRLYVNNGDAIFLIDSLLDRKRLESEISDPDPSFVACGVYEIIEEAKIGDPIWFDDGKIGCFVEEKLDAGLKLRVTSCPPDGCTLKKQKGINLPETQLSLPSLTPDDLGVLPGILEFADIIGYSFVRTPEDVRILQELLKSFGRESTGLVFKIENKEAFENLPKIILQGMKSPSIGIMTARGDLAVELGAERLSEVQEEIMWLCEAAMIPNIWATQVLDTLAKTGKPSRAEITDAAMSVRTECVMLNKGPFIFEALHTLQSIISRMETHLYKKQGTLRPLNVATKFFKGVS